MSCCIVVSTSEDMGQGVNRSITTGAQPSNRSIVLVLLIAGVPKAMDQFGKRMLKEAAPGAKGGFMGVPVDFLEGSSLPSGVFADRSLKRLEGERRGPSLDVTVDPSKITAIAWSS